MKALNVIKWNPEELTEIKNRASKLSLEELKELTELVGIHFMQDENMLPEYYIDVLDEADSKETILAYLKKKGV